MKHHHFSLLVILLSTVFFVGCTTMWPIKMDSSDFSKIEDTQVSSLVLKNGKTIFFGKDGGWYVKAIVKDTVYTGIVGYDILSAKLLDFPMHEIASVEGEHKEVSIIYTVLTIIGSILAVLFLLSLAIGRINT